MADLHIDLKDQDPAALAAYLRVQALAGDRRRAQEALDRYEPWADYVLGGGITQAAAALAEIAAISGGPIRRIAQDALEKMETD
ncbi:hypothetical protein SDC9_25109 [bioreactor metagenome]|uniref:Uncharacterized protein n=1 Tax=bioreactor metagenome TaxID=1076179 RepID=A0A644UKC7_9ZZZZ